MEPEHVQAAQIAPPAMPTPTAPASTAAEPPSAPAASSAQIVDETNRDSAGVPFDATKHTRKHPKTGRWMPRGGRKPRQPGQPAAGAPETPAPSFIPKDAPPPSPAESNAPESKAEPASAPPVTESGADYSADAGECVSEALQFGAGVVFDAPDDCAASPAEHKRMSSAFAAFVRSKNWQATAAVAAALVVVAFILRTLKKDKPRAKFRSWFTPARPPVDVTPPDARPKTAAPAKPAEPEPARIIEIAPFIQNSPEKF